MNKIILHIDLNQFFVRCEQLKNPKLEGKPVIIGHSGRSGIVSTCSYEARKYGVSSGMPTFKALRCCPNAILIDCDYEYYKRKSDEFFAFLRRYTEKIEIASIDECYLDFTSILSDVSDQYNYLLNLQLTLRKQTGLNCSIGVAPTKFLAKMGSDLKKPNGITFLFGDDIQKKLYPLPIGAFFGIGKKSAPRLEQIGIKTIGDLANAIEHGDENTKRQLGRLYWTADDWIHGRGNDELDLTDWDPKSLGHSTTLDKDCSTFEEISSALSELCSMVSSRAKRYKKRGLTLSLVVKDTGFKLHNKTITLKDPTNEESIIYDEACRLYKENYEGLVIRLIGVTLGKFIVLKEEKEATQMNLWNYEQFEKNDKTNKLIKDLNSLLSKPLIKKASDLKGDKNGNK